MLAEARVSPKQNPPQVPRSVPPPEGSVNSGQERIEKLLLMEAAIREAGSLNELQYLVANEFGKLVPSGQILVHRGEPGAAGWRIEKISSVAAPDRNAPLLVWLNQQLNALAADLLGNLETAEEAAPATMKLRILSAPGGRFPFPNAMMVLLKDRRGKVRGGISFLSARPFGDHDKAMAQRLADTSAHAWAALSPKDMTWSRLFSKRGLLLALVLLIAIGCIPVRLTVMAPVKVVARDPFVVAAPLDGVVEKVLVEPNTRVRAGDPLFNYELTVLESEHELASGEVAVATAKYQRALQSSFGSGSGKRELALAKSELEVAIAKQKFASEKLKLAKVTAPASGMVLFSSKEDWTGRPVATGERIIRIANLNSIAYEIDLAVADAIILDDQATVRIFLDSDPLNPLDAGLAQKSYRSKHSDTGTLVFPLRARPVGDPVPQELPRIGLHGTAQLFGKKVPLAYNFLRKPLAKIRQYLGV